MSFAIPHVIIEEPPHKFILAYVVDEDGVESYVVRARPREDYIFHNAILAALRKEPGVAKAECEGGGRLAVDHDKKVVTVSGTSTQFGDADIVIVEQTFKEGMPEYRVQQG